MVEYSKYNIIYRLQKWLDSVPGQTFMNYAYSWGASIVILATLFKLTYLPGADVMLFVGMGTEVVVFFISAFDRPFDKTAEGRNLPTHVTEEYLTGGRSVGTAHPMQAPQAAVEPSANASAEPVSQASVQADTASVQATVAAQPAATANDTGTQPVVAAPFYVPQMSAEEAEALNEAQSRYVDELQKLVETLSKVNEQSMRLTRDSEEMENLNRTLTGISKIYEMQLKGASMQVGTIDQINDQSRKMAQQIEQLNQIYARMIQAMTVNMQSAQGTGAAPTV
ncbi:gliding motility protein GldL [Prevotella sp. CAG:924]|nr:gliding motility protein GldL [Prevotella sp. CAG:924]